MASWIPSLLFLSLLSHSILLTKCDVDDDLLLQGINLYRTSRNLTALNQNDTAEDCLADEIADTYTNRVCPSSPTNSTTLPKFSDYPGVLARCGLAATNASGEGQILVACAPVSAQQQSAVLAILTTNYPTYLNSTQLSAIGIGTEDDWAVLVLNYAPNTTTGGGGSTITPTPAPNTTTGGGGGSTITPAPNTTTGPGGSGDGSSRASSLTAMSPLVFAIICLFTLV